jgi:hypothetical protein
MSKIIDFIKYSALISSPTPYTNKNYQCVSGWKQMNFFESLKLYENEEYKDWKGSMINLIGHTMQYIVLDADDEKANDIIKKHCIDNNYNIVSTPSYSHIHDNIKHKNHYYFKLPKTDMTIKKKVSKDHPKMLEKFGLLDIITQISEHKNSLIEFHKIPCITQQSLDYFYMTEEDDENESELDDSENEEAPKEEHSEDKINDLLKLLSNERGNAHSEWLTIGSAIKAIDKNFVVLFDSFCKKRQNYKGTKDILFKWKGLPKNQGIGTLCNMAKKDNPDKYLKWRSKYCKSEVKEEKMIEKEKLKEEREKEKENEKEKSKVDKVREKEEKEKKIVDDYLLLKSEIEQKLFMTTNPISYRWVDDDEIINYSLKELGELLAPKKIEKKSFVDLWLEDENRRTYKKVDFVPLSTDPKIFNTFLGFKYDNEESINMKKIKPFLKLISDLLDNEEESIKCFLDWCAWIRQRPNKKTNKSIVLYSEVQGVGKNTIIILLQKVFSGYVGKIERIEEITAKFNTHLASKLFIYADEVQAKAREVREELKNMITRDVMKVEGKGTNAYYMQDFSNYIFTTNNRDAFYIEATDRRFYMFNLANKVMTEEESIKLYKLLDDDETIKSFDTFLKNRELPDQLPKMMNKYKESLISNSLPAYIKMIYDNVESYEGKECTTVSLFRRAQQYAKENALQWTFSKEKFQKEFKKEFIEFHRKTRIQNIYKFPVKEELIKILMSKRRELMTDYILDDDAEEIQEEDSEAESVTKTNDLNL